MEKNELSTTTRTTVNSVNNNCQNIRYAPVPGTNSNVANVPGNNPGIVGILPITRDSRGPRSLYLRRHGNTYGFTLRHFIVYPPDAITDDDRRHAACGALQQPMDTIFVKSVRDGSSAARAGLRRGDRLLAVNGCATSGGNTYQRVVQLIAASAEFLHLLVVPKEEDVLQRFFPDTAYNPVTNRASATQFLAQHLATTQQQTAAVAPSIVCGDLAAWQQLLQQQQQHQHAAPSTTTESEIYAEISQQNGEGAPPILLRNRIAQQRATTGGVAQPQVPIYQKKKKKICNDISQQRRRASLTAPVNNMSKNNNNFDYYYYYDDDDNDDSSLRRGSLSLSSNTSTILSQDGGGDDIYNDNLSSSLEFMQDSARLTRMRQSVRQKEAFLNMSKTTTAPSTSAPQTVKKGIFKEFHPRAERVRIDQPIWPPPISLATPPTMTTNGGSGSGLTMGNAHKVTSTPKLATKMGKMGVPEPVEVLMAKRGVAISPPLLQNVQKRAKKFEYHQKNVNFDDDDDDDNGGATAVSAENDNRLSTQLLTGSELSRLTKMVLMPNVTERAHEFDRKSTTTITKKTEINRKPEMTTEKQPEVGYLTGNVIMTTGSKYIHCPPPGVNVENNKNLTDDFDSSCNDSRFLQRERSNSADSWMTAFGGDVSTTSKIVDSCGNVAADDFQPQRPARGRYSLLDTNNHVATCAVVMRRTKKKFGSDTKRPESYLRATKSDICQDVTSVDDVDEEISSSDVHNFAHLKKYQPSPFYGEIEQLRQLFEEKKTDSKEDVIIKETAVNLKVLEIDGRRATDRSWKPVQMLFLTDGVKKKKLLFVNATTHSPLSPELDMRKMTTKISVADDYTKRKNVIRINVCRHAHNSEFLVQLIGGTTATTVNNEFQEWFDILTAAVKSDSVAIKQKAEPQHSVAKMSIQVPLSSSNIATPSPKSGSDPTINNNNNNNNSPTKSSKTWRGRVVKQLKKFNTQVGGATALGHAHQHANHAQHVEEGLTFGVPLTQCQMSIKEAGLPRFVELCTEMIESKGLNVIGIYRVPGNNAAITALTDEVNRTVFPPNGATIGTTLNEDSRWNDVHVISSLLKSFLRKMPDSLVTSQLYPEFIKIDKYSTNNNDAKMRMRLLKRLLRRLPRPNYVTLRHVMRHLKRVADACAVNRMEVKNLAIVFGPTIIRPQCETMESMVSNMTFQCKIVESLITHCDWFFSDDDDNDVNDDFDTDDISNDIDNDDIIQYDDDVIMSCQQTVNNNNNNNNNQFLLDNISKYEALKEQKEKNGALLTSLFNAAQRKVMRKSHHSNLPRQSSVNCQQTMAPPPPPSLTVNRKTLTDEEEKNLDHAPTEIASPPLGKENSVTTAVKLSTCVNNVNNKQPWFNYKTDQSDFSRRIEIFKQETEAMLQQPRNLSSELSLFSGNLRSPTLVVGGGERPQSLGGRDDNIQCEKNGDVVGVAKQHCSSGDGGRGNLRRGSSAENLTCVKKMSKCDGNASSTDSLLASKLFLTEDEESLLSTMTKLIDEKLKEPATMSSEKMSHFCDISTSNSVVATSKFNDPSLHRRNHETMLLLLDDDDVKNEKRGVAQQKIKSICQKEKISLHRSESLKNRVTTPIVGVATPIVGGATPNLGLAPPTQASKPLKRSVSLTKTEKTDLNLTKRRELMKNRHHINKMVKNSSQSENRCSIKRRHTVGGTKDPDKITYLIITNNINNNNETTPLNDVINVKKTDSDRNHRTSSPDLTHTMATSQQQQQKQRLFFEINFFDRYDNNDRRRRHHVVDNDITLTLRHHHHVAPSIDANNQTTNITTPTTTITTPTTLESHV